MMVMQNDTVSLKYGMEVSFKLKNTESPRICISSRYSKENLCSYKNLNINVLEWNY